jgi:anti-anti-sigma factor
VTTDHHPESTLAGNATRDSLTSTPGALELLVHAGPQEIVVTARGELDLATAPALSDLLGRLGQRGARVRLDLSATGFMDSAGWHLMQSADRFARNAGWTFSVGPVSDPVRRLLDIIHGEH